MNPFLLTLLVKLAMFVTTISTMEVCNIGEYPFGIDGGGDDFVSSIAVTSGNIVAAGGRSASADFGGGTGGDQMFVLFVDEATMDFYAGTWINEPDIWPTALEFSTDESTLYVLTSEPC